MSNSNLAFTGAGSAVAGTVLGTTLLGIGIAACAIAAICAKLYFRKNKAVGDV